MRVSDVDGDAMTSVVLLPDPYHLLSPLTSVDHPTDPDISLPPECLMELLANEEGEEWPAASVRSSEQVEVALFKPEETPQEDARTTLTDEPEHPHAKRLHPEAYALYQKANATYRATEGHVDEYIRINNAVRSTVEQAGLYEKYFKYLYYGGPVANPANKPGKSYHEYGMAIDIVRGDDEERLRDALEKEGWQKINADEGWHFEARSVPAFETVTTAIQGQVARISEKYVTELDGHYRKKKLYDEQLPGQLAEEARLRTEEGALRTEEQTLRRRSADLTRRRTQLQQESSTLTREASEINSLTVRYNNMVYDRCPKGNSYENCDHVELKQAWLAEKQELYNIIERRRTAYNARRAQYEADTQTYTADLATFRRLEAAYNVRRQKLIREQASARQSRARIEAVLSQSRKHRQSAQALVRDVSEAVRKIRSGDALTSPPRLLSPSHFIAASGGNDRARADFS